MGICKRQMSVFHINARAENADVWQCAIALGIIKTVSDNKFVGDDLTAVVGSEFDLAALGLIEQSAGADRVRTLESEILAKIGQGVSAVDNIFNDKNIAFGKIVSVKVKQNVYVARGL